MNRQAPHGGKCRIKVIASKGVCRAKSVQRVSNKPTATTLQERSRILECDLMSYYPYPQDSRRKEWQNPDVILTEIGLKPGNTFVDIGCGPGFFALPAARIVGTSGKVLGVDINEYAINQLQSQAEQEGLHHLSAAVSSAEEAVLCEECADFVFFGIDLHDFRDQHQVLLNAKHMLKPTGFLVNLDWKKEPSSVGPPMSHRFSQEHAQELITKAGFHILTTKDAGPHHYIIIAKR